MNRELYHQIQRHPLNVSEKDVVDYLDRARFDPRLMEVMTEFIRDFWWTLRPELLNQQSRKAKSPFVLKALAAVILDHCEMSSENRDRFVHWVRPATRGVKSADPQYLYIGLTPIASKQSFRELEEALPAFLKQNLVSKDLPFNKAQPRKLGVPENPPATVNAMDLLKFQFAAAVKDLKYNERLSNQQVIVRTGINRVFLSKILNNKTQNISVEYLSDHTRKLRPN